MTVLAPKTDPMSENGDPNIVRERVTRLMDMHQEQKSVERDAEFQLMRALYELRGSYRIEDMVLWTGWSRQTIYNKWRRHGFEVK